MLIYNKNEVLPTLNQIFIGPNLPKNIGLVKGPKFGLIELDFFGLSFDRIKVG